ncbi:hypothetical protein SLG_21880 [Sphingobium sp. SYK-6]|uniref:hypothetical protein n=1 Tax=Sphingobium sp. (strain NBRC 103272 / SYK-6) TaxID=627192 RepID=UPI00022770B7|nr:hypothetical protein [Sphingobium sp. SYK-6]BAK66863.1 hypothetical protein SLG_21880 [Sphingobium sp. SYK-6]
MDSPPYLFDQYAKRHGLSFEMAKRALLMRSYADQGKKIKEAASLVGISLNSAKTVARRMLIDFADWRPYARLEAKGLDRPQPGERNIAQPANELPLFS